jgi:glycolate oxidase FAD binding subunit
MPTATDVLQSACAEVREPGPDDVVDGVVPGVVARPASTDEVAEVLRAGAAHGLSVVPRGRGTKLTWGLPPTSADVLLDLGAMDRVLDHAAGDLIVQAQAGATLDAVQQVVGEARQRVTIDATVPGASVGGTIATNASGPRRMVGGTMRDLLIGLTVVRADGVVAKAGGRVVKNVAGYDLGKLVIGSYGTLAVVTDALFRLHPEPEAQRWVSIPVTTPAEAQRLAQEVVHSQVVPAAVEIGWAPTGSGVLTVLLEGREHGVAGRVATVRRLLGEESTEADLAPAGWAAYPWEPTATGGERATALKLTFVLSGLADVLAATDAVDVPVTLHGSAGTGVVYAAVPAGVPVEDVGRALTRLREVCGRHGGHAVVLDAAEQVKAAIDCWGPVPALGLMRRVKDQFDPDHRLSPGRFVGGI